MSKTGVQHQSLSPSYRWTSLLEVGLGVFLVLGHNVFGVVPNEVFFLFALFWVSTASKLERRWRWKVAGLSAASSLGSHYVEKITLLDADRRGGSSGRKRIYR